MSLQWTPEESERCAMTFDVVEVNIKSGLVTAFIAENKTERNAEAIQNMAVIRRGVEESFFAMVPAGSNKCGEKYQLGEESAR